MWDLRTICDACAEALRTEAKRRDDEHAAYGVDALDELELQAILRAGLVSLDCGVLAEQRYPEFRARRRRSEGDRCDIVLTGGGDGHLLDPLASDTLFGDRGVDPADAMWIEVKVAHQHGLVEGVLGAGKNYSSQLLSAAMRDVRKLAACAELPFTALLLIMFNSDVATAEHDLAAWLNRCLDLELPIGSPAVERFAIADRIGNSVCTTALVPIKSAAD